jgi:hypothetical protein
MEVASFVAALAEGVQQDPWEPTDAGYQLTTHSYFVKLRRVGPSSNIELNVTSFDGQELLSAESRSGSEAASDPVTGQLAYLWLQLQSKPISHVAQLDDVVREIRAGRERR